MYTTSSISKRLVLVPILFVVVTKLFLISNASSFNTSNPYLNHKCLPKEGKYKPGSEDEENLNDNIHADLHYSDDYKRGRAGAFTRTGSVFYQCRGDSYGPKCLSCFATAQAELRKRCPYYRAGIIWYDQCIVEFSSKDLFRKIEYDDNLVLCIPNAKNSSYEIETDLLILLDDLKKTVSTNKTEIIAAGEKRLEKRDVLQVKKIFLKQRIYAMVQCGPGVGFKECNSCLSYIIVHFKKCYEKKQGARVFLAGSCNFRYESYPFFNPETSSKYYKL